MNKLYNLFVITTVVLAGLSGVVTQVAAEEIVVTGNGTGSSNEVNSSVSQDVNVSQDNNADVSNDVTVDATTGNNSASDNTGDDNAIKTGDVQVQTQIGNNVNTSVASVGCCPTNGNGGGAIISGNGSHSDNSISSNFSNTVNINVNQNADITNVINGYASTGGNTADDNTDGDVSITTGDISVQEKILNKANKAFVSLGLPFGRDYWVKISGNGTRSDNDIDVDDENEVVVAVNNNADVFNESFWDLVTGENEASDNTDGDVSITTGDIDFTSEIVNDVNKSVVVIDCCKEDKEKPQPVTPAEKPVSPAPSGQGGESKPSKEEVQAAAEEVLPVTGNLWFFLALIGNIAVLILGTYMRLRSGRSPSMAAA